jgi:hypothetical protein
MSEAVRTAPGKEATPMRTLITVGTLTASFLGAANKARKTKGSTDIIDHLDVIAGFTAFFVLAVRARRARVWLASQ